MDREKVMRGLKIDDTRILPGYQIYHNYFRRHRALKGMTPAEECEIKIEGENKWQTVIQWRREENFAKKDNCDALKRARYIVGGIALLIGVGKWLCKC
jgi:hypothetical protein